MFFDSVSRKAQIDRYDTDCVQIDGMDQAKTGINFSFAKLKNV